MIGFNGYMGKILDIDLTNKKVIRTQLEEKIVKQFIGGSGLGAEYLFKNTSEETDPLGEDNLLMFLTGPMTGTPFLGSKLSIISKSPLTGIWGEATVGGSWGTELKKTGFDGIVIRGKSEDPVYIYISENTIKFISAKDLWGKDTITVINYLKEKHKESSVCCIGPAGEKKVKISGIFTGGQFVRAAARCGLGAVVGAKNLKAIVVNGNKSVEVFDKENLLRFIKNISPKLIKGTKVLKELGTAHLVLKCAETNSLPVKNWTINCWTDKARKISGEEIKKTIYTGNTYCLGCPIGCGKRVSVKKGKKTEVISSPEYEALALLGASCLVDNVNEISKENELCNKYGIDVIDVGNLIAFTMECFENGLINEKELGFSLSWGDYNASLEIIKQIGEKQGFGSLLGNGIEYAAKKIGGKAIEYAMHVKGLSFPAHDPRAFNSLALGYATSNRGACHLQGFTHIFERNVTAPEFGFKKILDPQEVYGKGKLVANAQDLMCIFDSLVMCKFNIFGISISQVLEWFNLVTGWDFSLNKLMKTGERIFNLKRLYNVEHGISRKDDKFPKRIIKLTKVYNSEFTEIPLNSMLNEYYMYRGWNKNGVPKKSKLKELNLI